MHCNAENVCLNGNCKRTLKYISLERRDISQLGKHKRIFLILFSEQMLSGHQSQNIGPTSQINTQQTDYMKDDKENDEMGYYLHLLRLIFKHVIDPNDLSSHPGGFPTCIQ